MHPNTHQMYLDPKLRRFVETKSAEGISRPPTITPGLPEKQSNYGSFSTRNCTLSALRARVLSTALPKTTF